MGKKKTYNKSRRKRDQIDHIPKFFQQRRSPMLPKRRTDFSCFSCSNAHHPQDLLLESPSSKEILSSVTIAILDESMDTKRDFLELPLVGCTESQDGRHEVFANCVEVPVMEVAQSSHFEHSSNRNFEKQRCYTVSTLEFTPDESQITESSDVCITPGSVVWAKTARQLWWPAEIMGKRSTSVNSSLQGFDGCVLVQYYGNHESSWVDPARDLSEFEDCFEERSCNPMEEFQDALKEALHQKELQSPCKQFFDSPYSPDCSNQQNQSPDEWNSSSSSRTESDYLRRRGKRERKPKVHFDEVTFPLKSARKVRRFRIMRSLGLAAPVGSPFSLASHVSHLFCI